jgi:hypothetical protein
VVLAIRTDEPAQCKYALKPGVKFDQMKDYFGSSLYQYEQSVGFALQDVFTNPNLTKGEYTVYIRCQDANANKNERDYFIKFETDPSPDLTPPLILLTSLKNKAYIAFNETTTNLKIYVNEPAECKWSRRDTGYDNMENYFSCATEPFAQSGKIPTSYECSTTLANLTNRVNNFFFKCRDKPSAPEDDRNTNEESYAYTLVGSKAPLKVESVTPVGKTIYTNKATIEVKTKGGAENGKAYCAFSKDDVPFSEMVMFSETEAAVSKQKLEGLPPGDYNFYIICMDEGANEVKTQVNFTVDIDLYEPEIESLNYDQFLSELSIKLDEDATCEYLNKPNFVIGEGTRLGGTNTTLQATTWDVEEAKTLYIQCKDRYGNVGKYTVVNLVE